MELHAHLEDFQINKSESAFEAIVRAYAAMVYTVCLGVTQNPHDAEDAAQATFLALATQVRLGKSINYLGPWLRQVAKRTALDLRKSRIRRRRREAKHGRETAGHVQPHEGERLLDGETYRQILHEELEKLPERYREPLKLHYLVGLKPEEAALELNCKPQTLAVRLHRGRKLLASGLGKRGMFLSAEMVGLPLVSAIPPAVRSSEIFASVPAAAAASHALDIRDIISVITAHVMSTIRSTSKVGLFARLKIALAIMVALAPLVASGQQLSKALTNVATHWKSVNMAKLLHSMLPTLGLSASATVAPTKFAVNVPSRNVASMLATMDAAESATLTLISAPDASLNRSAQPPVQLAVTSEFRILELVPPDRTATGFDTHLIPADTEPVREPDGLFSVQTAGSAATPEPRVFITISIVALLGILRRRHATR